MKYSHKSVIITTILVILFCFAGIAYIISMNKISDEYSVEGEGSLSISTIDTTESTDSSESSEDPEPEIAMIKVHVAGAVTHPDSVYTIDKDSRVEDAIKAAGGLTDKAELDFINLAAIIYDGQKIYIPSKDEDFQDIKDLVANNIKIDAYDGLININTASKIELTALKGIGESIAGEIIDYREKQGPFKSTDELKNVNGIGDATYETIKDEITY